MKSVIHIKCTIAQFNTLIGFVNTALLGLL